MVVHCTNIGPAQRRRRLRLGIAGALAAVASGFALASAPALLRALIFIPIAVAAYGFFQYREKT